MLVMQILSASQMRLLRMQHSGGGCNNTIVVVLVAWK